MKELHIPYGIERDSGDIVEPEDAARGRACNCLCPGCEAPLLSRHPQSDSKRVHFAHDSKHQDAKPIGECPLSPFVALGMMLRHLSSSFAGKTIQLTTYCKSISFNCCDAAAKFLAVTEAEEAVISAGDKSPSVGGVTYDLGLVINGKYYLVEIIYPGKLRKEIPELIHLKDIGGIFSISGPEFLEMMGKQDFRMVRYSESVSYFLLSYSRKLWSYRDEEVDAEARVRESHVCKHNYLGRRAGKRKTYGVAASAYGNYKKENASFSTGNLNHKQTPAAKYQTIQESAEAYRRASQGAGRATGQTSIPSHAKHEKSEPIQANFIAPSSHIVNIPLTYNGGGAGGIKRYECLFCNIEYDVKQNEAPTCPRCNSHLGARSF